MQWRVVRRRPPPNTQLILSCSDSLSSGRRRLGCRTVGSANTSPRCLIHVCAAAALAAAAAAPLTT
jgi:hypothetical protein